jgi:hypothetical protein
MVRKPFVIIGRDAAPSVSDILRRGSAPIFTPEFPKADPYHRNEGRFVIRMPRRERK